MSTPTPITGHQCPECSTIHTEPNLTALYECSRCGETTTERRCDTCNIFAARAGDGCEDCAAECEEIEAVEDHDGALIPADEWDPDTSQATRAAAARAEADRARAEDDARKNAVREAASEKVTVTDLSVGDWIRHPEPRVLPDESVQVLSLHDWRTQVGLVVEEHDGATVVPVDHDETLTRTPAPEYRSEMASDFGQVTFVHDGGAMLMSSAPRQEEYVIELSHLTKGSVPRGGVPCMTITRGTHGLVTVFGVFIDRREAEDALTVWEQSGRALAASLGDDAPFDRRESVHVEQPPFSLRTDTLGRLTTFALGTSRSALGPEEERPYLNVNTAGTNATVADAGALLGAVAVAREHLTHLDH